MQLNCDNCGAEFDPGRVSRKKRFAECAYCGTLHNIAEITARRTGREYVPPPVFLPKKMSVSESEHGIEIEFTHVNERVTGLMGMGLVFLAGMVITAYFVWGKGSGTASGAYGIVGIARVLWLLAGIPVLTSIYLVIAGLVNRQRVSITRTSVTATAGPLPVGRKRTTSFASIKGVRAKSRTPLRNDSAYFEGYEVVLTTDAGEDIEILSGFADPEVADVLRHYILQAVGLQQRSGHGSAARTRVLFSEARTAPPQPGPRTPAKLELSCGSCGSPIPKERIRKDLMAAECPHCGVIQDVRAFLRHGIQRRRRDPGFRPPWHAVVEPGRVQVWRQGKVSRAVLALMIFGSVGLLAALLLSIFVHSALISFGLVPLLLAGAATWGLWVELQGRTLAATPQGISAARVPFANSRRHEFPSSEIAQLVSVSSNRGFSLLLITRNNERVPLLDGLSDWAHALFLEQQIESILGIEDVAVTVRRPND